MAAPVAAASGDLAIAYRRLNAAYQQSLRYAEDVRSLYQQFQRAVYQSLVSLTNALEAKDPYTRGHSERVGTMSRRLATVFGLPSQEIELVGQAGLLHDIGKIGIPEAILRKPGPLDPDELAQMRRHPAIGAEIVAPLEFLADVAPLIRYHHERQDGGGYPEGLRGAAIPIGSRIIAVADVFDALTSDRPYRAAWSTDAALAHLVGESDDRLDPRVVAALVSLLSTDG